MKKLIFILTMTGLLAIAGCGNSEKTIQAASDPASGQEQEEAEAGEPESGAEEAQTEKGYLFESNGVKISVDADAEPLVDKLGEADSYFEAASCAFEGLDKTYTYAGYRIETYPDKSRDYIACIVLMDDSVSTPEGVSIGNSVEEMKEIYGEASSEDPGMLVYEKEGMELCFIVDNDTISSIEYRSSVLAAMY